MTALVAAVVLVQDQRAYVHDLARDTWRCIANFEERSTGLPFDNSDRGEFTSVSNIGFYLCSVLCAREWGFITVQEESARLDRTLKGVEKLESWYGFNQSWNSVRTLKPGTNDRWVSVLDSGNLCAALITLAEARPEFRSRAMALFRQHDWHAFWDESSKCLVGGYNTETRKFNRDWHLDALATDATLAQFFAVATGGAPADYRTKLRHDQVDFAGSQVLWPAQEGGGLFMQLLPRLYFGLTGSELSDSAKRYARAQQDYATQVGAPVWGWSASDNPDGGYLGWASLRNDVVTPHASGLAMLADPASAVQNLRKLESFHARSPHEGFYDALNWRTRKVSSKFLVLDQSMMLLGLTSTRPGRPLETWFRASTVVRRGLALAKPFGGW